MCKEAKITVQALDINHYWLELFEPIPIDSIFDDHVLYYSLWFEREIWPILRMGISLAHGQWIILTVSGQCCPPTIVFLHFKRFKITKL